MPIKRLDSGKRISPKQILPPIDLTKAGYQPLDGKNVSAAPKSKFILAGEQGEPQTGLVPRPPPGQPKAKSKKSKTKKMKCQVCNKKINLGMEFTCRCGKLLCSQHRLPETHECSFDYKMFGKEVLKKENPVVAADKLSKFE